jgi:hypothetical protein
MDSRKKWKAGHCLITDADHAVPIKHLQIYEIVTEDEEREETMRQLQEATNETDKIIYKLLLTGVKKHDE